MKGKILSTAVAVFRDERVKVFFVWIMQIKTVGSHSQHEGCHSPLVVQAAERLPLSKVFSSHYLCTGNPATATQPQQVTRLQSVN